MPRRELTAKEKDSMQAARKTAKDQKATALTALANPQFTNPKFWAGVNEEVTTAIQKAITKAGAAEKRAKIAKMKKELVALEGE